MKIITISIFLFISFISHGQHTMDFENFDIPNDSFLNGSSMEGEFSDQVILLPNSYNEMWKSWSGFAISNVSDTVTPGRPNQYASITGSGYLQSNHYAVGYATPQVKIYLKEAYRGEKITQLAISNSTYTYYSLLNGDSFAKKFGGVDGNDPDYYGLIIHGYHSGSIGTDSVEVILADYRFNNNDLDYISKKWQLIDLSVLGPVDSIQITAVSTDVGMFGINTPTYFCVDNISTTATLTSNNNLSLTPLDISPNPTSDVVLIKNKSIDEVQVLSPSGHIIFYHRNINQQIDISHLPSGIYMLRAKDQKGDVYLGKLTKL